MPKVVHYRNKCIGCNVCFEMDARYWRMSRKDGKASLVGSTKKGMTEVREIPSADVARMREIAQACPVAVIKV